MCGIAGAWNVPGASRLVSQMLKQLQHRGQDGAGIVSLQGRKMRQVLGLGLVDEVFGKVDFDRDLPGDAAIGHIRYTTSGSANDREGIQPMRMALGSGEVALCHNGNLTNFGALRAELMASGSIFRSQSDTELFFHLDARVREADAADRLRQVATKLEGAWTILALHATPQPRLIAAMDPLGFRPLSYAAYEGGYVFASETCALNLLGIRSKDISHLQPGKMLDLRGTTMTPGSSGTWAPAHRRCAFEHVYFSHPASIRDGLESNQVRKRLGMALAQADLRDNAARADIVTAVPDSSNAFALAYAVESGIPFSFALLRNHYTGRTFITPPQPDRVFGIRMKLGVVESEVVGKSVLVVDDSLVRGNTARKVVALLRHAGAREVHLRIGSPPVIHPCSWGIDTPTLGELSASETPSPDDLAKLLGADSLRYLPLNALKGALEDPEAGRHCFTCFTGRKPDDGVLIRPESLVRN